ncbi:putative chlorophyll(ide) b reductase [Helianthus annuus]|nr:putative chlorophyll(ide) b reductase [Helianthus annuus]
MAITTTTASSPLFSMNLNDSLSSAHCPPLLCSLPHHRPHLAGKFRVSTTSVRPKPYVPKPPMFSVSSGASQPMVPPYNVLITGSTKG